MDNESAEWPRVALAEAFPGATFACLQAERIGEGYGFASRIRRYRWWDEGKLRSAVVKLWDTDGLAGKDEQLFYGTFPDVGARVPACYYGAYDEERQQAVLVLEDLQDVVQGDVLAPLERARAEAIARSLAGLHATWLEHARLDELSWLSDVSLWKRESEWFASRRALFIERFGDRLQGLPRALLAELERAPAVANERLGDAPVTLLHGDLHLDNILFEKGTAPVLLDWSRIWQGPAALNVVELLFEMVEPELIDALIACYLEAFEKLAGTAPEVKTFEKQLGGALLRKFATATCGIARWQPESERGAAIMEAMIERASRAVVLWQERDPGLFSFLR